MQGVQPKLSQDQEEKAENNSFFCLLAPKSLIFASQKWKWKDFHLMKTKGLKRRNEPRLAVL